MKKNTLIRLLESLDRKESKEFDKFLRSPFFNQRKDVVLLFEYFLEAKSFLTPQIDKERLFENIYPGEVFDDAKVRHLMSYLTKLVKEFFVQLNFKSVRVKQKLELTAQLKSRGLQRDFEKEWINAEQLNREQPFRNSDFHYDNYSLHLQRSEHLLSQKRQGDMNLQELSDELNAFYISSLLKHSCSILTHQKMSSRQYDFHLLNEVLKVVEKNNFKETPAVAVYYYSLLTLKDPEDTENFVQLKKLIEEHGLRFPLSEMRDIYLIAINYCIKKLNSGKQEYIREAFDLYRSGLEKKVFLDKGVLSLFTYKNILKLGLELKEFNWVEKFLSEYKSYLNPIDRENHYAYCQAVFYFNKPEYDQVLKLLQQVEFKDILHQLDARRMLLRIYYELNEINALESLLDSFQAYIRRQEDIGYHKENYLNLIRFVRKLLKHNLEERTIRQELKTEIDHTKALAERRWLLSLLD